MIASIPPRTVHSLTSLVFSLSLISSSASADVADSIGHANDAVSKAGMPEGCATCSNYSVGTGFVFPKMTECLTKLCKIDGTTMAEVRFRAELRASQPMPEYDSKYAPLIDEALRGEAKNQIEGDKMLLDFIHRAPRVKDPGALRLHNLIASGLAIPKMKLKVETDGRVVVDEAKSRPEFPTSTPAQFEASVAATNQLIVLSRRPAFETTDPARLRILYSGPQLREKIEKAIAKIAANRRAIVKNPDLEVLSRNATSLDSMTEEKLRRQFENGELTTSGLENLNSSLMGSELILRSATDPVLRRALAAPVDVAKVAREADVERTLRERIKWNEDSLANPSPMGLDRCRLAYALAHEMYTKDSELPKIRTAVDALKARFLEKTADLVCEAGRSALDARGKKWAAALSPSVGAYDRAFERSLRESITAKNDATEQNRRLVQSKDVDTVSMIALAAAKTPSDNSETLDRCQSLLPNYIPDATVPSRDEFIVGPATMKNPEAKEGVTFHELGHKLWYELSGDDSKCPDRKQWVRDVGKCLLQNHTELTDEEKKRENDLAAGGYPTTYELEDFADLVASRVESKSNNFACLLVSNLDPATVEKTSLRAQKDDDHSSALFRMLHLEYLKRGSIPDVCREALAKNGEHVDFRNCLDVGRVAGGTGAQ